MIGFQKAKVCTQDKSELIDLEEIVSDYSLQIKKNTIIPDENREKLENYTKDLLTIQFIENNPDKNKKIFNEKMTELKRKYKIVPKKSQLYYLYRLYKYKKQIEPNIELEKHLISKSMRSESGVLVISVIMPPDNFSCAYDCHYCPNDPRYSRSYFHGEPTVMRGAQNDFDAYKQFYDRALSYFINGHNIDKVECIILGGTFDCYDPKVSEHFMTQLYYASNNVFNNQMNLPSCGSLEEEILKNENALCHIIGITIETRPDKISKHQLRRLRSYGVTRVQIGIQHTDDAILDKLNRQCNQVQIKNSIKLLKDNCFKVDIHLMPDLPGSTIEKDYEMFATILSDPDYQADQWKIYPCNVLEFTKIKEWYDAGEYKPYAESDFEGFFEMIIWVLRCTPSWIRINRIQRDFPGNYIEGGNKYTNLHQMLDDEMKKNNYSSNEIRWNEVKSDTSQIHKAKIVTEFYSGSDGLDVFISHKSCNCKICWSHLYFQIWAFIYALFGWLITYSGCGNENKIYSFIRLRLNDTNYNNCFSKIYNNKLRIRELHVYGKVNDTYSKDNHKSSQHVGFGRQLLKEAEILAKYFECDGLMVIAGVGTRNYYRKFGYDIHYEEKNHGGFMVKYL